MAHPFRRKYDWVLYEYRLVEFWDLTIKTVAVGLALWVGWQLARLGF